MKEENEVLNRTVAEIQESILDDERRIYSEKVIDHFLNPRNIGGIEIADGFGSVTGPCGDTMLLFLSVRGGEIVEARFMTDGCGSTVACGSMITELAKGKTIEKARQISELDVTEALDGLPESSVHCSLLAANTLQQAIDDYCSSRDRGSGSKEQGTTDKL